MTTTPMALTRPPRSSRPFGSGPLIAEFARAASTRSRTSGRTRSGRLKTLEAVPCDTPAALATSASRMVFDFIADVTGFLEPIQFFS